MSLESVSIIICTKDRSEHLEQTLASLARVHNPDDLDVELIVVDNNSDDDTAAVGRRQDVPFCSHRVLHEPRTGLSNARNRAFDAARGDLLLLTDDDVRLPKNWISRMTRPIRNGQGDAVAGGVRIAPHLERPWMEPWHRSFLASSRRIEEEDPLTDMIGANMCVGRHVLEEVSQFDPRLGPGALGLCGESLFALQLHRAGFQIAPAFDTVVEHHFDPSRLSRESFLSAAKRLGRSMAYIHHTHLPERSTLPEGQVQPYLELFLQKAKLLAKHLLRRPYKDSRPPFMSWENYHVRRIAYLKQSLRERT